MEGFLSQAVVYLAAAVIAVPIASRMGLGSVLGYLAAGIIIGPVMGLVGSETADLQHFAEFGVVMMLFVIGLELEPRALWDPDKPVYENEAYVARAKELEQELESTMLSSRTGEALDGEETQSEEGKEEG